MTATPSTRDVGTRRSLTCALLVAGILPVGIAWRTAPLHLPAFAFKYGGSMLWATAVYWATAALLPRKQPVGLAARALLVAFAVELFKLVRIAAVDRFRETLAGKLLLGRYFTVGALVAYALAILFACCCDAYTRPGVRPLAADLQRVPAPP